MHSFIEKNAEDGDHNIRFLKYLGELDTGRSAFLTSIALESTCGFLSEWGNSGTLQSYIERACDSGDGIYKFLRANSLAVLILLYEVRPCARPTGHDTRWTYPF